ncbi:H+ Antiporter protein [Sphingobacterium daejeonense]|nr:H+ Antiporter protein [Sphingobacterium daejeonense]
MVEDKLEMSIIEVVWGVGMLVGGSALSAFKVSFRKILLINVMHIVLGLTFVLSGILPPSSFILFVVLTGFGGASMSIFNAVFMTIIQEEIAADMLGRVFSLYFSFAIIPSLIGLLFAGNIADHIGVANAFIIAGLLCIVLGVVSFMTPSLMKLGLERTSSNG